MSRLWVSPEIVDQVLVVGMSRAPHEACGIIAPDSAVIELPNSSLEPERSFSIGGQDLVDALNEYLQRSHGCHFEPDDVIVWHTHPQGQIGPSRGDMDIRHKTRLFRYLVIALPNGEATEF